MLNDAAYESWPLSVCYTSKQEVQTDVDDHKMRARTTVTVTFAVFGAIVLALRAGKSDASVPILIFLTCVERHG